VIVETIDYTLNSKGPNLFWSGNALYWAEDKQLKDLTRGRFIKMIRVLDNLENIKGLVETSISISQKGRKVLHIR